MLMFAAGPEAEGCFEVERDVFPCVGIDVEALENRWQGVVYLAAFVLADDATSGFEEFKQIKRDRHWKEKLFTCLMACS